MVRYKPGTALITGGASGIGAALASQLVEAGTSVIVADLNATRARPPPRGSGRLEMVDLDVSAPAQIDSLFKKINADYRALDLVVNCAGVSCHGAFPDFAPAEWDRILGVNLRGTIDVSLAALAAMREHGSGCIVNLASMSAFLIPPLFGPYITSKTAVIGFSRALGIEAEGHGILVSVACPGNVRTPMLGAWKQSFLTPSISPEDAAARILEGIAKRRKIIVFPFYARAFWYLDRLSPSLLDPFRRAILRRARARR